MAAANATLGSKCSVDLRSRMLACHQEEYNWCWATCTADVGHFFNPLKYPKCHGLECLVAGHHFHPEDPQSCCTNKSYPNGSWHDGPCDHGAWGDVEGIRWLAGAPADTYTKDLTGPMSQDEFDATVSKGMPLILYITCGPQTAHNIIVGGCSQSGVYYVHDPLQHEGSWKVLSYSDVLSYWGRCRYAGTIYPLDNTTTPSPASPTPPPPPSTPAPTPRPSAPTPTPPPQCPEQQSCGCDWTQGGSQCGTDDGSECWCRCCCKHVYSHSCRWAGYVQEDVSIVV